MENKRGLTLVEVVVAMAVFMIIVAMAFPILTQSGLINAKSKEKLDAQEIGILVMEELVVAAQAQPDETSLISHLRSNGLPSFFPTSFNSNLEMTNLSYTVKLEFNPDPHSNIVKVIVNFGGIRYETLEWLTYD